MRLGRKSQPHFCFLKYVISYCMTIIYSITPEDFLDACFEQNHNEIAGLICSQIIKVTGTLISMVLGTCKLKVLCREEYDNCL